MGQNAKTIETIPQLEKALRKKGITQYEIAESARRSDGGSYIVNKTNRCDWCAENDTDLNLCLWVRGRVVGAVQPGKLWYGLTYLVVLAVQVDETEKSLSRRLA